MERLITGLGCQVVPVTEHDAFKVAEAYAQWGGHSPCRFELRRLLCLRPCTPVCLPAAVRWKRFYQDGRYHGQLIVLRLLGGDSQIARLGGLAVMALSKGLIQSSGRWPGAIRRCIPSIGQGALPDSSSQSSFNPRSFYRDFRAQITPGAAKSAEFWSSRTHQSAGRRSRLCLGHRRATRQATLSGIRKGESLPRLSRERHNPARPASKRVCGANCALPRCSM
jgi:hypothetical protein